MRDLSPLQSAGETLADMNGDGLLDRVLPGSGNSVLVGINTGAGFAPLVPWNGVTAGEIAHSANLSVGGGLYFTITIGIPSVGGFLINPGAHFDAAMNREEVALRDIDGDGFPDHLSSTGSDQLVVASNLTGRTNLLRPLVFSPISLAAVPT